MEECAWLEAILNKNVSEKSIARVLSVDMKCAVPEGNNYASVIYRATLEVILNSGSKSKLTLIIKKAHESQDKVRVMENFPVFKTETMIYDGVLTKFEELMNEHEDYGDKLWCKLLGYKPYTMLVFEDLMRENFRMGDRTGLLDKQHALLVLNGLGRYHAMGHILIKKGLISKGDLAQYYLEDDQPIVVNLVAGGLKQLSNVIKSDWSEEWKEIAERLAKEQDDAVPKLNKLFPLQEDCFQTVAHGDCWTCNMMFKYCPYDNNLPIAIKFLDFQTTHINSYGFDIAYFAFISVKPDVRRAYWDELLMEYHNSLKSTLTLYGFEESTPSLEHLHEEMKRLKYYSFIVNVIYLPLTSANVKDAFKLENLGGDQSEVNAFNPEVFKDEKYKSAIQIDLRKWMDEGLY